MASGFNRVILMGNLTRDPELRYTPQGTAVADLSLAVNTRAGKKDETLFVDVTVWDRTAENCCEYLSKGRPLLVEGRLAQDTWEDRETGQKRSKMRVVASGIQFLGGGQGGGSAPRGGGRPSARRDQPSAPQDDRPFEDDFGGDDIPF